MRPVFCGNFEYDARESELERLFRKYGKVERVDMKAGFAFIYMEDERDAEDAIRALDRIEFGRKGRRLRVEWTKNERGGPKGSSGSRRSSSSMRPSKTLFVINFDAEITRTRDLERHFEPYGKIVNVRIRRNFAFVQYEAQEDATRALDATNMSKLMDRVISVEYAVNDDDVRRNGYSPERRRERSPERRRRSPSPYRRERGSPDYGRGSIPSAYRRERGSPDYGRDRGRGSPEYVRKERNERRRGSERGRSPENGGYDYSRSPYKREKASPENGNGVNHSPYGRVRESSAGNGDGGSRSPYRRERSSPENGQMESPILNRDRRDSRDYDAAESPIAERRSP